MNSKTQSTGAVQKTAGRGVFTRDRNLTFNNLIAIIIIFKSSIQRELDSFFKALSKSDFKIREVTKGALTQARAKLNPWVFIRLNEVAVNTFYSQAEYYVWNGMRIRPVGFVIPPPRIIRIFNPPSHHTTSTFKSPVPPA